MNFDINSVIESKQALRQEHARLPLAEKLRMLDTLRARAIVVNPNMNLNEKGHRAGCECGFCRNKGSFGKKKADGSKAAEGSKKAEGSKDNEGFKGITAESIVSRMLR